MASPRSVVLTGGDHAGKTALAEALAGTGLRVVPEAAMRVIDELVETHGVRGQERWRAARVTEFQSRVASLQLELEAHPPGPRSVPCVFDRGLPDGVAFCRLAGAALPPELTGDALRARYDAVIVLDTITPFDARRDTGRVNDLERSYALRDALMDVYFELGYAPVVLPAVPLAERVARVRELVDPSAG